jgi:hypothetical protein
MRRAYYQQLFFCTRRVHIFDCLALLAIVRSNLHDWSVHYISASFLLQLGSRVGKGLLVGRSVDS